MASSSFCSCATVTPGRSYPHHLEEVIAAVLQHLRGRLQRQPDALLEIGSHLLGKPERGGHDADDRVRPVAQGNYLAQDVRIGVENPSPQTLRQHHNRRPTSGTLGLIERAPQQRRPSQHGKEAGRQPRGDDAY